MACTGLLLLNLGETLIIERFRASSEEIKSRGSCLRGVKNHSYLNGIERDFPMLELSRHLDAEN